MKLTEAIKKVGKPYWIPDCGRDDLPGFFKQLGFTKGAKIGVEWGTNLVKYCQAGLKMYGIDPYTDYEILNLSPHDLPDTQSISGAYEMAERILKEFPNCKIIKKTSIEALSLFPNGSLDFVYIDASHKYGHVAMDLTEWCQKVKKGGIISGHDYFSDPEHRANRGVRPAVDGFVEAFSFKNFWVLGSKHPKKGEKNDGSLSYMMLKYW